MRTRKLSHNETVDEPKRALRVMLFDRTCRGWAGLPGLSASWRVGGKLYGALGRLDAWRAVSAWPEALEWLATIGGDSSLAEIQFWGHGKWGRAFVDRVSLDEGALARKHAWNPLLRRIAARLTGPSALWWFRTCETFGDREGHSFARAWSDFFGCRAAGHTYVIGPWQSGLHSLSPGAEPQWDPDEGLIRDGRGQRAPKARPSGPFEPNTITCFHGAIPAGF